MDQRHVERLLLLVVLPERLAARQLEHHHRAWYGKVSRWGTPMFGNATALERLHVTGRCRDKSMPWDPHTWRPTDRVLGFCELVSYSQPHLLQRL